MSLTRRRLFQRLVALDDNQLRSPSGFRPGAARRRAEFGEQAMQAGGQAVRIASNENPLGPGQHVLDAIVGKFPEAGRYPFNAQQNEGRSLSRQPPSLARSRRTSCWARARAKF